MDGEFVAQQMTAARRLDGVDVTDDVGHGHVGGGELFHVALVTRHPRDGRIVASVFDEIARVLGDGGERIVVHLAARHHGHRLVEQRDERAQDARLRLTTQPQQNEVVPRQQRVDDLRHHGVFVAQHTAEQGPAVLQAGDEVPTDLVLDVLRTIDGVAGAPEGAEGLGESGHDRVRHGEAEARERPPLEFRPIAHERGEVCQNRSGNAAGRRSADPSGGGGRALGVGCGGIVTPYLQKQRKIFVPQQLSVPCEA